MPLWIPRTMNEYSLSCCLRSLLCSGLTETRQISCGGVALAFQALLSLMSGGSFLSSISNRIQLLLQGYIRLKVLFPFDTNNLIFGLWDFLSLKHTPLFQKTWLWKLMYKEWAKCMDCLQNSAGTEDWGKKLIYVTDMFALWENWWFKGHLKFARDM